MNHSPITPAAQQKGVVLLEALIAILIFSFGVLALAGLQASMIQNTTEAKYRAEAAFIAQDKISEIWIGGQALGAYIKTDDPVPQLPSGKMTVAVVGATGEIKVTVKWTVPGGTEHRYLANTMVGVNT